MTLSYEFATKPYAHQKKIIPTLLNNVGFGLLWDMGVGKTLPVICELDIRKMRGEPMGGLVFCPRRVMGQWETQIPLHSGERLTYLIPEGSSRDKIAQMKASRADVIILYYETIPFIADYLKSRRWPFVILDESTAIKNPRAARTKVMQTAAPFTQVRRIMSGLPNPNSPADLFAQFEFIRPGIFGNSMAPFGFRWQRFKDRYCVMGGPNQRIIVGYKNLSELTATIQPFSSLLEQKDVIDLPELTYFDIDVEIDGETLRHYESMRDELRTWWDGTEVRARIALTQMLRLAQIAGGTVQDGEFAQTIEDTPKILALDEILEETIQKKDDKVVVFAIYEKEIEHIVSRYPQFQPRAIYGKVPERVSTQAWKDFQRPGDPGRLMVCQSHSGGIGIDLYAARTAVFYTRDYSQEAYRQAIKRLHRIGQTGTVRVLHLIARLPKPPGRRTRPVSIDESISKNLEVKARLSRQVLAPIKYGPKQIMKVIEEVLRG